MRAHRVAAALGFIVAGALPLRAQSAPEPDRPALKLQLGASGGQASMASFAIPCTCPSDTEARQSGAAFGALVGYGFTPFVSVFAEYNSARITADAGDRRYVESGDSWSLWHLDLGARYHIGTGVAWLAPYLEGAFTVFSGTGLVVPVNTEDGALTLKGTGLSFGAGVRFFVQPGMAVTAGYRRTSQRITEKIESDQIGGTYETSGGTGSSSRLTAGVTWFPMARR